MGNLVFASSLGDCDLPLTFVQKFGLEITSEDYL